MNYQPDWLRNEVMDGLCKLVTLSLERTPAVDVIVGTAETWMETLCHRRQWDQSFDQPRVRAAFATLAATCTTWPLPKQFLDAMPARVTKKQQLALASPEEIRRKEESRGRVLEMLEQFGRKLGIDRSAKASTPRQPITAGDDFPRCCENGTREKPLCDGCRAWAQEVHGHGRAA